MTVWMLALAMAQGDQAVAAMIARARTATRIVQPCRGDADPDEIVVCAARHADRYRAPLIVPPAEGDAKIVDAPGERERLLAVPAPACGTAAFLQRCGFAGVTASTRRGGTVGRARPLAQ
ncbi:hypothetical protein [Sphingomonas hankookensis]|uniref:Uncharacterized protein n=1 Tax=Sphingomonas hengshuiensis TaxID=1609977 RepID=A0A2W4ZD08_9SPHN|nr:MAG: hypothetical protein DI632_04300 [Sphingomonas hengshuiensis]